MNNKNFVEIYTDGACSGNPGPGGWGALIKFGGSESKIWGYSLDTTNNKMELVAPIEALKTLDTSCTINLYTDSIYLRNGITLWIKKWVKNDWRKSDNKPVLNCDLWKSLMILDKKHKINWNWVKGHSNNLGNEVADELAVYGKNFAIKKLS